MFLGGPFLDDTGGMMICREGVNRAEIEDFADDDPTVISGLLRYEIKPWMAGMSAE